MKLIKQLKCHTLKRNECYRNDYVNDLLYVNLHTDKIAKYNSILENLKREIDSITYFGDIINYKVEEIDEKIKKIVEKFISISVCTLDVNQCYNQYYELNSRLNSLRYEYNSLINRIKHCNDVFEHLKELNSNKQDNYDSIYFKTRFDKEGYLVCTFFDKSTVSIRNSFMHSYTIYLSFGYTAINNRTRLYFEYSPHLGALKIIDFFSIEKRRWHGSYVLQTLLDLVPYFNEEIDKYNKEVYEALKGTETWESYKESSLFSQKVKYIYGSICPGGSLTKEELIMFYDMNGFIKNERLYREV